MCVAGFSVRKGQIKYSSAWLNQKSVSGCASNGDKLMSSHEQKFLTPLVQKWMRGEPTDSHIFDDSFLQQHCNLATVNDAPGIYTVVHQGAVVTDVPGRGGTQITELQRGTIISVLEVLTMPEIARVRARIEEPSGWLSLRNTQSGYRWAEKGGNKNKKVASWPASRRRVGGQADGLSSEISSQRTTVMDTLMGGLSWIRALPSWRA